MSDYAEIASRLDSAFKTYSSNMDNIKEDNITSDWSGAASTTASNSFKKIKQANSSLVSNISNMIAALTWTQNYVNTKKYLEQLTQKQSGLNKKAGNYVDVYNRYAKAITAAKNDMDTCKRNAKTYLSNISSVNVDSKVLNYVTSDCSSVLADIGQSISSYGNSPVPKLHGISLAAANSDVNLVSISNITQNAPVRQVSTRSASSSSGSRRGTSYSSGSSYALNYSYEGYKTNKKWAWPLGNASTRISSGFGYRTLYGKYSFHGGIDITGPGINGKPIYATRAGVCSVPPFMRSGYGNYVIIDHQDGYKSVYGHCSKVLVSNGAHVEQGQVIALVGTTGYSTGPHLHFEIRYKNQKLDPRQFVSKP